MLNLAPKPISAVSFFPHSAGASLPDAEATIKSELLGLCRAKPGLDSPYMSPEQVNQFPHKCGMVIMHS